MITGGGGNTAVFITANGVVVVDTKHAGWGQPILDKIKERHARSRSRRSSTRTRTAITSAATTSSSAHGRHRRAGEHEGEHGEDGRSSSGEQRPRFLPKKTFKDKMTLGKGAERDRPVLLRPRPHERRRVGRLSGAARRCTRATCSRARRFRSSTRTTAAALWSIADTLDEGRNGIKNVDTIINGSLGRDDDVGGPEGVCGIQQGIRRRGRKASSRPGKRRRRSRPTGSCRRSIRATHPRWARSSAA